MARHQLTGGGGIAFQRSGVGDWVALLSKGFTQRHHQSTHFSFFRGRHGITMGEHGGYRDGVQHSPSYYFIFSLYTIYVRLIWQVQHRGNRLSLVPSSNHSHLEQARTDLCPACLIVFSFRTKMDRREPARSHRRLPCSVKVGCVVVLVPWNSRVRLEKE